MHDVLCEASDREGAVAVEELYELVDYMGKFRRIGVCG